MIVPACFSALLPYVNRLVRFAVPRVFRNFALARVAALGMLTGLALASPAWAQTAHPLGTTSTLASGFSEPVGIAVDSAGNVYVADEGHNAVKEIPYSGGSYGTPVTLGAGFLDPFGVAVDGAGNVYVADTGNNAVKEIPYSGGSYGTPVTLGSGFYSPTGVAVDSAGNVYVADTGNNAVKEIPYSGGSYGTPVTLGSGFSEPFGIAVDGAGNVYVVDIYNNAVEKIPYSGGSYGTPVTLGGGFYYPFGVTVDSAGNVYVADTFNNAVKEIPYSGGSYGTPVTLGSGFYSPAGVAVDGAGNVYVADYGNGAVKEIEFTVDFGAANVGVATPVSQTVAFQVDTDGTFGSPVVLTGGAPNLDFTLGSGSTCAGALNSGSTCNVVVNFSPKAAGGRTGAVELVSATGAVLATAYLKGTGIGPQVVYPSNTATTSLGSGYSYPYGVAVDGAGNVYVGDTGKGAVEKVPYNSGSYGTPVTLGSGFRNPVSVAVDGAGNVYVADEANNAVKEIPYSGGSYGTPVTLGSGFIQPCGVAVDGAGNVYVADYGNSAVKEIPYSGGSYGTPVKLGSGFREPYEVAVDGAGNLFVADFGSNAVKEIPYSGGGYGTPVTLGSGFFYPLGVAVDGGGNVYVADTSNGAVKEIPYSGGSYGTPVKLGSGFNYPVAVAVDSAGNVYVADVNHNTIKKIALATAPSLTFPTATIDGTTDTTDGPLAVTVGNIGNAPLTFYSPTPSISAGFNLGTESTSCVQLANMTLAAGSSCTLTTTFAPLSSQAGTVLGSISLTDNHLNQANAQQSIPLSGTAQVVLTAVTHFDGYVGTVALGSTTNFLIYIANPSATSAVSNVTATVTLPAGLSFAGGSGGTCGAASGSGSTVMLSGISLAAGGSCQSGIYLTATQLGSQSVSTVPAAGGVRGTATSVQVNVVAKGSTVSTGLASGTETYPVFNNFVMGPSFTGPRVPTGTVTLSNNGVAIITLSLGGDGKAYYTTQPPLNAGVNNLTVSYSGDANFPPGVSPVTTITVLPAPVLFQATCQGALVYGTTYQCQVNVSASTPTQPVGNITYSYDGGVAVSVPLTLGNAGFTVPGIPNAGSHTLIIGYSGQGNFAAAASLSRPFVTQPGQTQLLLSPSTYYTAHGSSFTLSGTATSQASGVPPGVITLYDNGVAMGTANIGGNGVVSFPVTNVAKGQHTYFAKYAGTTNYAAATSASSTVTAY